MPAERAPDALRSPTEPADPVVTGRLDGQDLSYRTVRPGGTADWLVLVTVEGCGQLCLPGRPDVLVAPGQVAVIEPRTPHDYGTDRDSGRWSLRWAHILPRPEWLLLLDWPSPAAGIRRIDVDATVHARIVRALDRATAARHGGLRRERMFAMNAVEEALLWCDTANPRERVMDPRLRAVLEHVGHRLDEPHTVASLARVGGVSPSRLAHLASAQLGTSLIAYVDHRRMERARHLLRYTDLPIAHVAGQVGFADPLHFSRRFRALTAMSPSRFRSSWGVP
ncbi:helix-turn-helix domain-containing protein [Streptomyces sp. NPDC048332]|uniref:helix-turn-helix domain-containing protein n=1 Tax=Streptomyces sp. NPDC048332 TaxID=3154619 RepID=UPI003430D260